LKLQANSQLWQILLPARRIHVIVLVSFQAGVAHGEIRRRHRAAAGAAPGPVNGSPPEGAAKKGGRERRIVDLLNRGISMAELAAAEG
jgi:hypothetical protein